MRRLGLAAALLLAACSYKSDLQMICDSPSKVDITGSPADRAQKLAQYISEHMRSAEGKKLFQTLAAVEPEDKEKLFRAELEANGIKSCAFLDLPK